MVLALLAAHCILQSTDRVLHLAGSLFGLAFSFQLLVAEDLPCGFFHRSFGLLCPLIRSLSIADILVIYLLGVYGNDLINVNRVSNIAQKCMEPMVTMHV
jgi:hypothetical protein